MWESKVLPVHLFWVPAEVKAKKTHQLCTIRFRIPWRICVLPQVVWNKEYLTVPGCSRYQTSCVLWNGHLSFLFVYAWDSREKPPPLRRGKSRRWNCPVQKLQWGYISSLRQRFSVFVLPRSANHRIRLLSTMPPHRHDEVFLSRADAEWSRHNSMMQKVDSVLPLRKR